MRLTNPRHSIHDAFAIHLGGPSDNLGSSGGKFNSTKWLANAGVAGLVIRAVMNQPAHLRATAIFLNAPENTITANDMLSLKAGIWGRFIQKATTLKVTPADQGILVGYLDRILMGYRARIWNHESQQHTMGAMFNGYTKERAGRLTELANAILNGLQRYDQDSLDPVQDVIDRERENGRNEAQEHSASKARIAAAMAQGERFEAAKKRIEEENARTDSQAA